MAIYLNPLRVVAIKFIFPQGRLDYKIVWTLNPIEQFYLGLLLLGANKRTLPLKSVVKLANIFSFFFFESLCISSYSSLNFLSAYSSLIFLVLIWSIF